MNETLKFEKMETAEEFDGAWYVVGGVLSFGIVVTAFLLFT